MGLDIPILLNFVNDRKTTHHTQFIMTRLPLLDVTEASDVRGQFCP